MGTWSHEPFGNDAACDWAYALEGERDYAVVAQALHAALDGGDDGLDADIAVEAIAAAEVLAKALGRGTQSDAYTEDVDAWLKALNVRPPEALPGQAIVALDRTLAPGSDLRELWMEGDGFERWETSVQALKAALAV